MENTDFIITRDINEVTKIHSNPDYSMWRCEVIDGEYRFYSPNYKKTKDTDKMVSLESLGDVFAEPGYLYFGHGTGRTGNSDEIVNSIFKKGLRTKDNSLYYTTIALSAPTPELISQYKEFGYPTPTIDALKQQFNNWGHADSKKIIIARIPMEYINEIGDRSDLDGERYGAFMKEEMNNNGKTTNYLDPKFIIGCFDVDTQMVKLNETFEKKLSVSTTKELKEKYKKTLQKTQERLERSERMYFEKNVDIEKNSIDKDSIIENKIVDSNFLDFEDDNIEWDIPDETNNLGRSR